MPTGTELGKKDRQIDNISKINCSLETEISDIENKLGALGTIQEKIKEFNESFMKICEGLDKTMKFFSERFDDLAVNIALMIL